MRLNWDQIWFHSSRAGSLFLLCRSSGITDRSQEQTWHGSRKLSGPKRAIVCMFCADGTLPSTACACMRQTCLGTRRVWSRTLPSCSRCQRFSSENSVPPDRILRIRSPDDVTSLNDFDFDSCIILKLLGTSVIHDFNKVSKFIHHDASPNWPVSTADEAAALDCFDAYPCLAEARKTIIEEE